MERKKIPDVLKRRVKVDEPKQERGEIPPTIAEDPKSIYWKKVGRGTLVINGRLIKPNQVFMASIEEIPVSFRDVIQPINRIPVLEDKNMLEKNDAIYSLQKIGENLWNIVDKQGKVLNETPMLEKDANDLIKML